MKNAISKFAQVALIGKPNAGKSTLINQIIGQKIAITTPKAQTTRFNTKGIVHINNSQLVFIDTPGLFTPNQKNKLEIAILKNAWRAIRNVDLIGMIVGLDEIYHPDSNAYYNEGFESYRRLVEKIITQNSSAKIVLILNKIDLLTEQQISEVRETVIEKIPTCNQYACVSALKGDKINDLVETFASLASPGQWIFNQDQYTDVTERLLAEEITRKQLYLQLKQELPYSTTIETVSWKDQEDGGVTVHQNILVLKQSQKTIIIGKNGHQIKQIGSQARQEIMAALGRVVHLFLEVKVDEDWINKNT